VHKKLAHYDEAARVLRNVQQRTLEHYGATHMRYAVVTRDLADVLRKQDRLDEARALYERALAVVRAALGREHDEVADILNALGLVDKRQALYNVCQLVVVVVCVCLIYSATK
jgi:tetratricopeptide (TPR) repeat protein